MVTLAFWIIDRNLNERRKLQARHRGKISFFCKQARIVYKKYHGVVTTRTK